MRCDRTYGTSEADRASLNKDLWAIKRANVRQPVQHNRGHGVQANLERKRRGAARPGWAAWQEVGQAVAQAGQGLGGQPRTWAG